MCCTAARPESGLSSGDCATRLVSCARHAALQRPPKERRQTVWRASVRWSSLGWSGWRKCGRIGSTRGEGFSGRRAAVIGTVLAAMDHDARLVHGLTEVGLHRSGPRACELRLPRHSSQTRKRCWGFMRLADKAGHRFGFMRASAIILRGAGGAVGAVGAWGLGLSCGAIILRRVWSIIDERLRQSVWVDALRIIASSRVLRTSSRSLRRRAQRPHAHLRRSDDAHNLRCACCNLQMSLLRSRSACGTSMRHACHIEPWGRRDTHRLQRHISTHSMGVHDLLALFKSCSVCCGMGQALMWNGWAWKTTSWPSCGVAWSGGLLGRFMGRAHCARDREFPMHSLARLVAWYVAEWCATRHLRRVAPGPFSDDAGQFRCLALARCHRRQSVVRF